MQENISVTDSYSTGNAAQAMLEKLLQIYDVKTLVAQLNGVGENHWSAAILKRALANDSAWHRLSEKEFAHLQTLLPKPPAHHPHYAFRFIDLFAGIGGIRRGFESIGGQCVFTSEWNKHAVRTYKANHYCDPATHHFNEDIRDITLSHKEGVSDEAAAEHIRQHIPEHDVLLAGFPCQPFSLAGVSKKNSLGRAHGFACDTQGTLFFDVVRIIDARTEAKIVQDADRLEALGAIGLARVFAVSGALGVALFDGEDPFAQHRPLDDKRYALDHFQTKLLKLPQTMQTARGKQLAQHNAHFLVEFMAKLSAELAGENEGVDHKVIDAFSSAG